VAELPEAAAELGIQRPLFVTDPVLAELDVCRGALEVLARAEVPTTTFSNICRNPTGDDVSAGVQALEENGCDGVIAFGGGAALDVAKAVALMAGQSRPLWDFEDVGDNWTRVDPAGMVPCVAVPTTSGTGSEVGRAAVIVEMATHTKRIVFHPGMLPGRVIADPELTVGLPAGVTAAVGMDALSHNLEALCAPGWHPLADGIAVEGIRLVEQGLERAYADGRDLRARGWMMAASTMGATAFQKGLGAMHALAHPIGAVHDTHHGLTNAVLMPYVLRFNYGAISERLARLAAVLGLPGGAAGYIDRLLEMRESLQIPHRLSELGVSLDDVGALAQMAAADPSAATNPIPLTPAALAEILSGAIEGRV